MRNFLLRWVLLALAIFFSAKLTSLVVPGFEVIEIRGLNEASKLFLGAGALALINATLGNLIKFLTLPISCLTLGLFSLIVNAGMLMLAGSLELGFRVDGFLPALVGSIILAVVNAVLGSAIPNGEKKD